MAQAPSRRPILVTGCPRSGTTWVGSIIGVSPSVFHVYEPFNDQAPHHLRLPRRFMALGDSCCANHRRNLDALFRLGRPVARAALAAQGLLEARHPEPRVAPRLAARALIRREPNVLSARRVCIKDPLAFFSAEWIARQYQADVVVMLRHPLGVISSYLSLGWQSELAAIADHPLTRRTRSLADELQRYRRGELKVLDELILQWRYFTLATLDMRDRHPDWTFVVHDNLCLAPEREFEDMFARLSLVFDEKVRARIRADSAATNVVDADEHSQHLHQRDSRRLVDAWRSRLDRDVVSRILDRTGALWHEVEEQLVRPDHAVDLTRVPDAPQFVAAS